MRYLSYLLYFLSASLTIFPQGLIHFYLYETKQDVLLSEARPDSIKCFLFAELIGLAYPMFGLAYPNSSWRV